MTGPGVMTARHHLTVTLGSWSEVLRMCRRRAAGELYVRVRGPEAELGDLADVKLTLPDSLGLVVEAQVQGLLYDPAGGPPTAVLELLGFTHELACQLEAVVERARRESARWRELEPIIVDGRKVSELLQANRQLATGGSGRRAAGVAEVARSTAAPAYK